MFIEVIKMTLKFVNKSQFNVQLSHFLLNGLGVLSAQLGMSRSEIIRLALYNLLKETYTKQEMDVFASRDDVVEEWIVMLQNPGTSKYIEDGDSKRFVDWKLKEEKEETEEYTDEDFYYDETEKKLEPIKKKYAFPFAAEFMEKTNMNPQRAAEYFQNYREEKRKEYTQYRKDVDHYYKTNFPKEEIEIEEKLVKLKGLKNREELHELYRQEHIDYMIKYFQDTIDAADNYMDDGRTVADAKKFLKIWQLKKEGKTKEADELLKKLDQETKKDTKKHEKKKT